MSEPKAIAQRAEEIVPGVWRWAVHDDRIDYESDAHAVVEGGRVVLIDPLPLAETALKRLGTVEAVCLTAKCHQRSAWRYRKQFGVKVYAPQGVRPMEEEPDVLYRAGDLLPGGLQAIHTPGPENVHYAFWLAREPGVLFCPRGFPLDPAIASLMQNSGIKPTRLHHPCAGKHLVTLAA